MSLATPIANCLIQTHIKFTHFVSTIYLASRHTSHVTLMLVCICSPFFFFIFSFLFSKIPYNVQLLLSNHLGFGHYATIYHWPAFLLDWLPACLLAYLSICLFNVGIEVTNKFTDFMIFRSFAYWQFSIMAKFHWKSTIFMFALAVTSISSYVCNISCLC